ncbi:hypothetical protein KCP73_23935 [Salmonella enterica subsp. enterica]|nr:hypothetical protein KCP73_23935 [Salmonella enterica subsp. enterica]
MIYVSTGLKAYSRYPVRVNEMIPDAVNENGLRSKYEAIDKYTYETFNTKAKRLNWWKVMIKPVRGNFVHS